MAERAVWKGTLSMGLVNVPIQLGKVIDKPNIGFHQINKETGNRIAYKRVDAETEQPVSYEQIVKGYEQDGKHITVEPEELAALKPKAQKTIDIIATVPAGEIDARQLGTPYTVKVDGEAGKQAYALMSSALGDTGKVAIGKFVMRENEHLVAIYPRNGELVAQTINYADQVRESQPQDLPEVPEHLREQAAALVDAYSDENFSLDDQVNEYNAAVKQLIEAKLEGKQVEVEAEPEQVEQPEDLMAALAASVEAARARRATGAA